VFISYSTIDRPRAHSIVDVLRRYELSVWWDQNLIGEKIDAEIRKHIKLAKAVVVLLSRHAANSDWVGGEIVRATKGASDKIVPVRIDDVSLDELPTQLLSRHILDLSDWNGEPGHADLLKLVARCKALMDGGHSIPVRPLEPAQKSQRAPDAQVVTHIQTISGGTVFTGPNASNMTITIDGTMPDRKADK